MVMGITQGLDCGDDFITKANTDNGGHMKLT